MRDFKRLRRLCLTGSISLFLAQAAPAADWPQYRADSGRAGHTPERLPDRLHLQWTYHAPHAPRPAWPDVYWQRQTYDLAYQPVIARGALYYGSSADCKVYALDAATGRERWSFFTDGPVRFAPAVWRDRLFVASDDGYLYCLAVRDGKLLWRKRGGLDDRKILGNGRMVSRWPARGGPVIHGNIVYFGAGIFPSQGFFLYALDPETGKTVWVNNTSGNTRGNHITGGYAFGNVTAQGYLAVSGDTLMVSTGRAVPAAYDLKTGAFKYFRALELSYTGGSWVMAVDKLVFNSDLILHRDTGYTLCNKVGNAKERITVRSRPKKAEVMIEAAASPTRIFVATGKRIKAIDRSHPLDENSDIWDMTQSLYFKWRGPMAKKRAPHKAVATKDLWSVAVDCTGTVIVAGNTVYTGGKGVVSGIRTDSRKTAWTHEVDGTAHGLAASGGRLYVSTDTGKIYCFGKDKTAKPAVIEKRPATPASAGSDGLAQEIIRKSGVTEGYCLDFGCGGGELAYALAKRTNLHVIAVDDDPKQVEAARRALDSAGLYGTRVTVLQADLNNTNLPDYFANLIVSARSAKHGESSIPSKEWQRVQRPCGGVAALGRPGSLKVRERGALEGAGSWTHQFGNSGNTACSDDTIIKGPLGVLWFSSVGPDKMPGEKSRNPAPLYVGGRVYYRGQHSLLRCVDAYNGRIIWEARAPSFRGYGCYQGSEVVGSNYCVTPDSVYITDYSHCYRLDGKTGKKLETFDTPKLGKTGKPRWGQTFVKDKLLVGTVESGVMEKGWPRPGLKQIPKCMWVAGTNKVPEVTHVFGMDRESGRLLWTYAAKSLIIQNSIAVRCSRVCFIDRPVVKHSDKQAGAAKARLVALDTATGKVAWTHEENVFGSMLAISEKYGVVLMGSDVKERGTLWYDYPQGLAVFKAADGKKLWEKEVLYKQRPMIIDRTIVAEGFNLDNADRRNAMKRHYPSAWDLLTGEIKTRANPVTGQEEPWIYGRSTKCSYVTSCANMLLLRNAMMAYFDLIRDEGQSNMGAFRPSCFINVLPVGGIVVAPNIFAGCQCNYLMRTALALQPIKQEDRWAVFHGKEPEGGVVRHLFLNLGALGDRRDKKGNLWFAMPRPPGLFSSTRSDMKTVTLAKVVVVNRLKAKFHQRFEMGAVLEKEKGITSYRHNMDVTEVRGTETPWVAASGCRGPLVLQVNVSKMPPRTRYRVRLHFAELEDKKPGDRVFDVELGDRTVLSGFDVVKAAGKTHTAIVKEFETAAVGGSVPLALVPKKGEPILCGVEVTAMVK